MGSTTSIRGWMPRSTTRSTCNILYFVVLFLSAVTFTVAQDVEASMNTLDSLLFQRLAERGEIHIDLSAPPSLPNLGLMRRQPVSSSSINSTASTTPTTIVRPASSTTGSSSITAQASAARNGTILASSSTATTSSTTTQTTPTALPTPFDTSLGNNFTVQTCPSFFNSFITNSTFKSCLPVSLLLQNSMGFFRATRSASFLDTVLDASCKASLAICSPLMASLADALISDSNCGQDYRRQNPVVMQAYTGLLAYEPLYNATCLENKATGNYCFVDAVVNATNAADMYPYYTAVGIPLPISAQPSCSSCLQRTMNIFAGYARQKNQPLAKTYVACATQIDATCGPTFANADVKVAVESARKGAGSRLRTQTGLFGIIFAVGSWLILM